MEEAITIYRDDQHIKTSITHPLRIDPVSAGHGQIGMTFCPGKVQPDSMTGPWDRDLDTDLKVIRDFGARALVTLMEDFELEMVQVPEIGIQTERLGIDWLHLPIVDVSIPDHRFERLWPSLGQRLRTLLRDGENIVLHCRGGLGRTGLLTGQLLVEVDGIDPEDAIRRVRQARPGTIETLEQENYVRGCRHVR
jgi:ADP-ribosyl-[dinitrogen reductase] hydrolase